MTSYNGMETSYYMNIEKVLFDLKYGTPLKVINIETEDLLYKGEYLDKVYGEHELKGNGYKISMITVDEEGYLLLEVF